MECSSNHYFVADNQVRLKPMYLKEMLIYLLPNYHLKTSKLTKKKSNKTYIYKYKELKVNTINVFIVLL